MTHSSAVVDEEREKRCSNLKGAAESEGSSCCVT